MDDTLIFQVPLLIIIWVVAILVAAGAAFMVAAMVSHIYDELYLRWRKRKFEQKRKEARERDRV